MRFRVGEHSDRGMTLAEVIIASTVLLVCLVSLAGLLGGAVTSSRSASMRDQAANLANDRVESARSLAYDHIGVRYSNGLSGDPAGDILTPETVGQFVVSTECSWVRTGTGRAAYKKITVQVSWQDPTPSQLEVTTMIYGKSNIVTSGDVDVRLRYREDASPVQDASIQIVAADNSQRVVTSGDDGEGFFGQVAIGQMNLSVTPPAGCIVDTSTLANLSVAADAVSTVIAYIQHPAQATIHLTDTHGAPVAGATVSLRRADGAILPAVATNANGDALFTQLLYSDYSATVTKSGYTSATVPLTVSVASAQPVVPVSISQLLGVGIHVRVFDMNGTQVPGPTVTIRRSGNDTPLQSGVAGSNGEISFSGFDAGTYSATVEKAGYITMVSWATLYDGDIDVLDLHLVPAVSRGNMRITARDKWGHTGVIRVIVSGPGYYRNDLWTDGTGSLQLNDLAIGSYSVQCYTKPASVPTVIVNSGQTSNVSISQTW
jgi:type II secretory pathway pseudopilin PulG